MDKPKKFVDLASEAKRMKIIWMPDLEYNAFDIRYCENEPPARISEDRLTYTGSTLWCSALTRGCATTGNWYFECKINDAGNQWRDFKLRGWDSETTVGGLVEKTPELLGALTPSVRIGYGTRLTRFESPIGSNAFGCSIAQDRGRIIQGNKDVTAPEDDMQHLKPGDVVGCAIKLGKPSAKVADPRGIASMWPFVRKGLLCDVTSEEAMKVAMVPNEGSEVRFSVNGVWKKTVVTDLYCVEYHPGVSTFMGASCSLNLGPDFKYAPPDDTYKPASEMPNSEYPCKEELLQFWILGDTSVLSEGAVISREYYKSIPGPITPTNEMG
ncbi:Set1 Ash2 histone methyltransferase complex subunit ASH2 [Babesia ovis]|uniref:Set1 Ash2 histone methyltransferase complex subunit ASH2 n=1 Tax=Babesia ovis TaxID=5869 RepID=A0A9W5TA23_BABOV|nr:Set1 Ash2 histone methyltransferase complex subunit ASH2 [Babesia ovis]